MNQDTTAARLLLVRIWQATRQSSRLITLQFSVLFRGVRALCWRLFPNLTLPIIGNNAREENDRARAVNYFLQGHKFLNQDHPEAAWEALRQCIELSTDPAHFFVAALTLIVGLGRYEEGITVFARGNALRQRHAKELGLTKCQIRFLDGTWVGSFGHIAELDYPIKLGILEGRARDDTILYVPPATAISNRFLLEQWRPLLKMVEHEADLPLPLGSLKSLCFDFRGPLLADGSTVHYWKAAAKTYRRWYTENRKPIQNFPADVARRGRLALEQAGVPSNAWFVALHVREASSKVLHSSLHDVLNAQISDYLQAIEEITGRGGWVIRMGDPAMTPLKPMSNVLDYCHSGLRSDWMDIFLFAYARFFVGTSSGPAYVPPIYGVPCVLTNWWPPAQRPWHPQDIFVPKIYRRLSDDTLLTLSESLMEPFGYCNSVNYLRERENVVVDDNAPNDIHAAVREMFERFERTVVYDSEDLKLRERAKRVYEAHSSYGMATISRDFLRKHRALIE